MLNLEQVEEEPHPEAKEFFDMLKAAEKPLYDGCQLSLLSMAARMTNISREYNNPDQAISSVASLMKDMCPDDNKMTEAFNATRKLVADLKLPHQKIDVCPNGCMLFWKDAANLQKCDICKMDRYKKNSKDKPIAKRVLTYFPITPRLQRLYATNSVAEQMRWHSENRRVDGSMAHPCDGEAWKSFSAMYPKFAAEPRNVRLGLYTDGFYPFGKSGKSYSCWPVMIAPYNMPPWLCLKRPFMFMSLIIPGPGSPEEKLDVYLQPLIEELKQLWDVGAMTYDVSRKQNFNMRAAVMWTISNFSAYGMLSGWRTEGRLACPYCMENAKSFTLENSRKETWFDCHRQFLPYDHVFRKNKIDFSKNRVETSPPPPRLTGDQLWDRVSCFPKTTDCIDMSHLHGKHNWTKQSIFWELPYWRKHLIRHNLDVMDIEEKFFHQFIIHNVMDDEGNSLENENGRKDLSGRCKHQSIHLDVTGMEDESVRDTRELPCYVLDKEKREVLCKWVQQLKFPDGYPSNLSRHVNLQGDKLLGMKSHDCHVFMERLLPVALRNLLPDYVWWAITELSQFFRDISRSILLTDDVVRLEKNIPEILCKLERLFPPTLFSSIVHMSIHLPYEAKVGGPVQYRWIYPFERFLQYLKGKLGTNARVESYICDAYLAEEISNFCTHYVKPHVESKVTNVVSNVDKGLQESVGLKKPYFFYSDYKDHNGKPRRLNKQELCAAHGCVLANIELREYEGLFIQEVLKTHPGISVSDVWSKFDDEFPKWFKKHILALKITSENILWTLAMGPRRDARKYNHYSINGYNFHTYAYGKNKPTENYGVCMKDLEGVEHYGFLIEVIELTYEGETCYRTTLFTCLWLDIESTIEHSLYKHVYVNFTKKAANFSPFVLPQHVEQVYFTHLPSIGKVNLDWWAVFKIMKKSKIDASVDHMAFQEEVNENPPLLSNPTWYDEDVGTSDEEDGYGSGKEAVFLEDESEDIAEFTDDESSGDYEDGDHSEDSDQSESDSCTDNEDGDQFEESVKADFVM